MVRMPSRFTATSRPPMAALCDMRPWRDSAWRCCPCTRSRTISPRVDSRLFSTSSGEERSGSMPCFNKASTSLPGPGCSSTSSRATSRSLNGPCPRRALRRGRDQVAGAASALGGRACPHHVELALHDAARATRGEDKRGSAGGAAALSMRSTWRPGDVAARARPGNATALSRSLPCARPRGRHPCREKAPFRDRFAGDPGRHGRCNRAVATLLWRSRCAAF